MSNLGTLNQTFVPKASIPLSLGKTTVYIYPNIEENWADAEKSYGFTVTKSALESADIPIKTKLQVLGDHTSSTSLVSILQARYIQHLLQFIKTAGNFKVLDYQGRNGKIILDCTQNNGHLKPVNDQTNLNRRPNSIHFVKLTSDVTFTTVDPNDKQPYPFSFFIRLEQEQRTVQNTTGGDIVLTTFYGQDDWAHTTDQAVIDSIWNSPQSLNKPFNLVPPAIDDSNADAIIEFAKAQLVYENLALEAAWPFISKSIFDQVCPNAIDDPSSVIQQIRQTTTDSEGNTTLLTVNQYFKTIQSMTNFLPKTGTWSIDIVNHFINHLIDNVRHQMQSQNFTYNPSTAGKDPFTQITNLQKAYAAACVAETQLNQVRSIAKSEYTAHALSAQVVGQTLNTNLSGSIADRTIRNHKETNTCWGCGATDHVYAVKGKILCPRQNDPAIVEAADKKRKLFNKNRKEKRDKKRKLNTMLLELVKMNEVGTLHTKTKSEDKKSNHVCFSSFVCLPTTMYSKPLLPISIDSNLPHIKLGIGKQDEPDITLLVAYDTCAVLNVGYLKYHMEVIKKYPHVVRTIEWAKDKYTPLNLTGVIKDDSQKSVQSQLVGVIEYTMPYLTEDGGDTSFKVAVGNAVAVNTIIGMSMIKPAKLSLDLEDSVVNPGILKTTPFKVQFKSTTRSLPQFGSQSAYQNLNTETDKQNMINTFLSDMQSASQTEAQHEIEQLNTGTETETKGLNLRKKPIIVPKAKYRPKTESLWEENNLDVDDSCFDYIYQNKQGTSLRKIKEIHFPKPNPNFHYVYKDDIDKIELTANLKLDPHIDLSLKQRLLLFIKEYWDVFRSKGVEIPIQGYEMIIDTGEHKPIAVKKPHYGLHEAPIMQKTIDTLIQLKHIIPDSLSPWGFRITLAPKPHQENVTDIDEYVWRFCINYIRLNKITRPAEYPIPRCDDAVMYGFGDAEFYILLDAFSGYHQVKLSPASQAKTAFYAPHGRKYIWLVMPFGLRNCPTLFIAMMHDLKEIWTEMFKVKGITPSQHEGTTVIMDDTFLFAITIDHAFVILESVCIVARKYHLTWKLKKCRWFPEKVEFVGVDVSKNGNTPAASKEKLIEEWKIPTTPREILSFISFGNFYFRWIPYYELKIKPLRELASQYPLDTKLNSDQFTETHLKTYQFIKRKLLSYPILQRASIKKRFYLKTDFSSKGLGFALCQPDDEAESIEAMKREDAGGACEFDILKSKLRLLPVAFGSRKTSGNEKYFHSHAGESLAASWATTRNRHFLWGRPFTLITDCRALLWLFTYKGDNYAVKRLQLELLGYWFTIVNRIYEMLADADYMSRLNQNTHIDPLLKDYMSFARQSYVSDTPIKGEITVNNLPGLRKKNIEEKSASMRSDLAQIHMEQHITEIQHPIERLTNTPVVFDSHSTSEAKSNLYLNYISVLAANIKFKPWCLYQPGYGHFIDTSRSDGYNFDVTLAIEKCRSCRDFLQRKWNIQSIKENLETATTWVIKNSANLNYHGYYATMIPRSTNVAYKADLKAQIAFISELKKRTNLKTLIIEARQYFPSSLIDDMMRILKVEGWQISKHWLEYKNFSDLVTGKMIVLSGINEDFLESDKKYNMEFRPPPATPIPMTRTIYEEFNQQKYAIPYIGKLFRPEMRTEKAFREPQIEAVLKMNDEAQLDIGFQIYSVDHPAPLPTQNKGGLFGQLFGIAFKNTNGNEPTHFIRTISTSEYVKTFGFTSNFNYEVIQNEHFLSQMFYATPSNTLKAILKSVDLFLQKTIDLSVARESERHDMDMSISTLFNGLTTNDLPDDAAWNSAYQRDPDCAMMIKMLVNPGLITTEHLNKLHYIFRSPIRTGKIKFENSKLHLIEGIANSTKQLRLIVVPKDLQHHIFIIFHVNPLGGHFALHGTLHRIRLRFIWPNMYKYIARKISFCAACTLKKNNISPKSELLYSFTIDSPMNTIHADLWQPGKTISFEGYIALMIVLCHMTGFAALEPVNELNSKSFAKAIYTIQLRYGLAQLIITDDDSKFKGEFKEACKLLKINHHQAAKGRHETVLVERFNRFLNRGLTVFNNDRKTNRVFVEGSLTLTYAWNSCPVIGTDISRSLLVVGREFKFPIDFEMNPNITYEVSDKKLKSFAASTLDLLRKCREIYAILIEEHRAYHREYRNSQLKYPKKMKVGDIVFTNVQVKSKKDTSTVKKLAYVRRGPYKISKSLPSGSYELQLLSNPKNSIKKHGSDIFLCPRRLVPYKHADTSDQSFSNLNKQVADSPYNLAGLKNYEPATPWAVSAVLLEKMMPKFKEQHFPTVQEMDDLYDSWPESGNPFNNAASVLQSTTDCRQFGQDCGPAQATYTPARQNFTQRPMSVCIADIIMSDDKLFYIAYTQNKETRREWHLAQVDLENSIKLHPQCLQDGRFLLNFYIQHHKDANLNLTEQRFWLEYHTKNSQKILSENFTLIQPSEVSPILAEKRNLVPYRDWVTLGDTKNLIHGPFDFATVRGRKTRDRISEIDWRILIANKIQYDNDAPRFQAHIVEIDVNQPIIQTFHTEEVRERIITLHTQLHFDDKDLSALGL